MVLILIIHHTYSQKESVVSSLGGTLDKTGRSKQWLIGFCVSYFMSKGGNKDLPPVAMVAESGGELSGESESHGGRCLLLRSRRAKSVTKAADTTRARGREDIMRGARVITRSCRH